MISDDDSSRVYTREELESLTIARIKEIAGERGYTITASLKADIIDEFLEQQQGE